MAIRGLSTETVSDIFPTVGKTVLFTTYGIPLKASTGTLPCWIKEVMPRHFKKKNQHCFH